MDAFRFCSHRESFVGCRGGAGLSRKEPALLAGLPGRGRVRSLGAPPAAGAEEEIDVGVDTMEGFMKERVRAYTEAGQRMGLGK